MRRWSNVLPNSKNYILTRLRLTTPPQLKRNASLTKASDVLKRNGVNNWSKPMISRKLALLIIAAVSLTSCAGMPPPRRVTALPATPTCPALPPCPSDLCQMPPIPSFLSPSPTLTPVRPPLPD